MVGGFVAYLMVAVPFGGFLAAWGFAVRRRGHPRAGKFMLAWGAGGPYLAPVVTGVTWLLFGFERLRADLRVLVDGPGPGDGGATHREIGTGSVV